MTILLLAAALPPPLTPVLTALRRTGAPAAALWRRRFIATAAIGIGRLTAAIPRAIAGALRVHVPTLRTGFSTGRETCFRATTMSGTMAALLFVFITLETGLDED
ncbi:hypothetical protein [Gluconobacter roseus]|uniref:hypothetical protein n=1 Tax=Gluconobacter roseus TaxID=586239 RepID=UPI0038D09A50